MDGKKLLKRAWKFYCLSKMNYNKQVERNFEVVTGRRRCKLLSNFRRLYNLPVFREKLMCDHAAYFCFIQVSLHSAFRVYFGLEQRMDKTWGLWDTHEGNVSTSAGLRDTHECNVPTSALLWDTHECNVPTSAGLWDTHECNVSTSVPLIYCACNFNELSYLK